jgi:hypothetical protein
VSVSQPAVKAASLTDKICLQPSYPHPHSWALYPTHFNRSLSRMMSKIISAREIIQNYCFLHDVTTLNKRGTRQDLRRQDLRDSPESGRLATAKRCRPIAGSGRHITLRPGTHPLARRAASLAETLACGGRRGSPGATSAPRRMLGRRGRFPQWARMPDHARRAGPHGRAVPSRPAI